MKIFDRPRCIEVSQPPSYFYLYNQLMWQPSRKILISCYYDLWFWYSFCSFHYLFSLYLPRFRMIKVGSRYKVIVQILQEKYRISHLWRFSLVDSFMTKQMVLRRLWFVCFLCKYYFFWHDYINMTEQPSYRI